MVLDIFIRKLFAFLGAFTKTAKNDNESRHVCSSACPAVRVEKLGSHLTEIYEILYLSVFRKHIEKILV